MTWIELSPRAVDLEPRLFPNDTLTLPLSARQKSRFRTRLDSGVEVAVLAPRGGVLRHGDVLLSAEGELVVEVRAAPQKVSTVRVDDALGLARAAYHLGNRHVALQIGEGWVRYEHDHVLDGMVRGLGYEVVVEMAPFEPEAGAYGTGSGHGHGSRTTVTGHGFGEDAHEHEHEDEDEDVHEHAHEDEDADEDADEDGHVLGCGRERGA